MTFAPDENAIGTVCFLTYNRGHILLKTIKKLLPDLNHYWPIMVVNNYSTKYAEEYKEIEDMAASYQNLHYYRHTKNILFDGNLLSLFKLVPTQFFMVVSDEDEPVFCGLDKLTSFLGKNRDIGGIRTSIGTITGADLKHNQATIFPTGVYDKGSVTSMTHYGLVGNYITGAIWNAPLLNKFKVPHRLRKNINANLSYPHLYLNLLTAANTRTMKSSIVTCNQGSAQVARPEEFTDYFGPFSYGHRIDQFVALRNAVFESFKDIQNNNPDSDFDRSGFYETYLALCNKYCHLIMGPQGKMYHDQMINLDFLSRSFVLFCVAAVEGMPRFERYKDLLANSLADIRTHFLKMRAQVNATHTPSSFSDFYVKSGNYDLLGKLGK